MLLFHFSHGMNISMYLHLLDVWVLQVDFISEILVDNVADIFSLKIVATDLQCMNWAFHHESHSRNVLELLERLKFEYNVCLIFSEIELLYCGFCLLSILVHVIWWSKFVFLLITGSRQISPAWRLCCLRFLGANGTGNSWYLICSQRGAEEVSCVLLVNKCLSSITCYCV